MALRDSIGPITVTVTPGKITYPDGTTVTKNKYGQPLVNPLTEAIRRAVEGDVISLAGDHLGLTVGGGNPTHGDTAYWGGNQPVSNIAIVGADPANRPSISMLTISSDLGGIEDVTFCDIVFKNSTVEKTPIIVSQYHSTGRLHVWSCRFEPENPAAWGGYGMMWNMRAHGRLDGIDMQDCELWPAQEHGFYCDSPGARSGRRSYFKNLRMHPNGPAGRGFGRTGIQIVNRKDPAMSGGPSGHGVLTIEDVDLLVTAGGGGYGITIAGHLGPVIIKDTTIRGSGNHGGIVFWSDSGKGLHTITDANGKQYTCPMARLENIVVDMPGSTNPHIAIAGVKEVQIADPFVIKGQKTCIDLWNSYSGPLDVGTVGFDVPGAVSAYSGFQAGAKVKHRNVILTNQQLDAMKLASPTTP